MTHAAAPEECRAPVRSDAPVGPVRAVDLTAQAVPAHLLDGGEIVLLAIKPSLWFIPMVSGRWIAGAAALIAAARLAPQLNIGWPIVQLLVGLVLARLAWGTLQWSTRLYVLTNRRVMRIRGVFNVQIFECPLTRLAGVAVNVSLSERILRLGTIHLAAAGTPGESASWRAVARPAEIHEQLRRAIERATGRGQAGE